MIGEFDLLLALVTFCVATLFTPGPNNIMLMTTGLNFGFRRALPHIFGVAMGFGAMVLGIGLGLGAVISAYPVLYDIAKYLGATYLLYLAWKIATSGPVKAHGAVSGKPMTFLQAVAFQWVNPKAWVMALGGLSTYAAVAAFPLNVMIVAGLFGSLGIASGGTWVGFGTALQRLVRDPKAVRIFNVVMALLLVASLIPIVADAWG